MAESARPRRKSVERSTKKVNYASLDGNDDSDDDFADFTPPPAKKTKKKVGAKKATDKPKTTKRKAPTERRVLIDEESFDHDLQLALAMSKEESSQTATSKSDEVSALDVSKKPAKPQEEVVVDIHIPDDNKNSQRTEEPTAENNVKETPVTGLKDVRPPSPTEQNEDSISFIETVVTGAEEKKPSGRGQRRAAKTATSRQRALLESDDDGGSDDSGDEYKADDGDLEESDDGGDDNEGDDEDFSFSPKKKKRKSSGSKAAKKGTTKKQPAPKRETKQKGNENVAPKPVAMRKTPMGKKGQTKGFTPPSVTSNSTTKSPNLLAVRQIKRSPVVISPKDSNGNNPLGGVKLVSPGQPFRLGLSRFARVKPLHSNVKVM